MLTSQTTYRQTAVNDPNTAPRALVNMRTQHGFVAPGVSNHRAERRPFRHEHIELVVGSGGENRS
ncbi:hypothetical protein Mal64_07620 [Pseudobythopirellula maris]|uniref:Uncharacterized protein n=1 Tax=Pseudobythopirellula maris TaxID=2527991 RepID=A0A5C5ZVV2_9BACT|nr:hypothetical protein Mal64_07620 [Pseudobythopirellula maris]